MAGRSPIRIRIRWRIEKDLAARSVYSPSWPGVCPGHPPPAVEAQMAGTAPYRMHRSWNRSAAAIATSSWPGLSGPPIPARAATDGPDKPGHDDGETLAAIEQALDFMELHGCFRNVCIP